ncbi:MAG: ribonuclease H-like domain-containing protein [bacterium JZ-2024 1]
MDSHRLKEWLRRAYERGHAPDPGSLYQMEPPIFERVVPLDADYPAATLARLVGAEFTGDPASPVLYREKRFPLSCEFGVTADALKFLRLDASDHERVSSALKRGRILIFDTETTGLAGGTGTLIFLAGIGCVESASSSVRVTQYFLPEPASEPTFLDLLDRHFSADILLVTYNGRAFDYPLLRTRYRMFRRDDPPIGAHLDLLPAVRRLLKFYIPDRSLISVEATLLQKPRHNDIPGELIPREYQMFLRFGEIGRLPEVFEHNLRDLLSLIDLVHLVGEFASTRGMGRDPRIAMARGIFEGRYGDSQSAYESLMAAFEDLCAAQDDLPITQEHTWRLYRELGVVARRIGRWDSALRVWRHWAETLPSSEPCLEIAKYYEHTARDFKHALHWAKRALSLSDDPRMTAEIEYRIQRLQRRASHGDSFSGTLPSTSKHRSRN